MADRVAASGKAAGPAHRSRATETSPRIEVASRDGTGLNARLVVQVLAIAASLAAISVPVAATLIGVLIANPPPARFVVAATIVIGTSIPIAVLDAYLDLKVIARMNLRIGPDRVAPFGALQSLGPGSDQLAGLQRCGTPMRRHSQLYGAILNGKESWSRHADSNCGPAVYETDRISVGHEMANTWRRMCRLSEKVGARGRLFSSGRAGQQEVGLAV